jgi:hypothetical protein
MLFSSSTEQKFDMSPEFYDQMHSNLITVLKLTSNQYSSENIRNLMYEKFNFSSTTKLLEYTKF